MQLFKSPDHYWRQVIDDAIVRLATDIHLSPIGNQYQLKMRTPMGLHSYQMIESSFAERLIAAIKHKANMDLSHSRFPQDGQFSGMMGCSISIRVSCVMTVSGQRLVLRLLKSQNSLLSFDKIGLSQLYKHQLLEIACKQSGLILFCGATGSGKTTTLYSLLNYILSQNRSIISLENPVEILIDGLHQIEYDYASELELSHWIRAILRQDPDVLVLSEIRGKKELDNAIKMSLSGHLVCSTFHAGSVDQAIARLEAYNIDRSQLFNSLEAIVYQEMKSISGAISVEFDLRQVTAKG